MKKIVVDDKCLACGACTILSEFLVEKTNGKVYAKEPAIINEKDIEDFKNVINVCPVQAISIEKLNNTGANDIVEIKKSILDQIDQFKVKLPSNEEINFNKENFKVLLPECSFKSRFSFRSDSQAESAGLQEFDRVMYSQRKALIQNVLIQYKKSVLNRYLEYKREDGNYYYDINNNARNLLKKYAVQIEEYTNGKFNLMNEIEKFQVIPQFGPDDLYRYKLKNIESCLDNSVMSELEPLRWYQTFVNTDDKELSSRYAYCFDIKEVVTLFSKHILDEISYVVNGETIQMIVNDAIKLFVKDMEVKMKETLNLFIKKI